MSDLIIVTLITKETTFANRLLQIFKEIYFILTMTEIMKTKLPVILRLMWILLIYALVFHLFSTGVPSQHSAIRATVARPLLVLRLRQNGGSLT